MQRRKGFSLMELLVAVALLAVTMSAVGLVFKMAVTSQRTASATAEIMRNLRAITDQLNADFKGFVKDAYFAVLFNDINDANSSTDANYDLRVDRIVLFTAGDFQSTRQYPEKNDPSKFKTVVGNVARIYYGQASTPDPNSFDERDRRKKILLRKVQILTADTDLVSIVDPNVKDEYLSMSLAEWRFVRFMRPPDPEIDSPGFVAWLGNPAMDANDPEYIPMYMAKGVDDFTIQIAFWDQTSNRLVWWPTNEEVSTEADLDPAYRWLPAIKFTFTLYDSKGILKGGRTFTHIVYIDE